jgi:DNA invertase Pin-like site-specific DNA recombinase
MEKGTKYGYARCSTAEREKKQSVEYQINYLKENGVEEKNIFKEYESGGKENRIEYNKLLKIVKPKDSIYTTDITRLSRSTKQLLDLIDIVKENHLQLMIGCLDVDCRNDELNPVVKGMLSMMAVFSEFEKNMIHVRIKEGLVNAKKNGKKLGRPPLSRKNIPDSFFERMHQYENGEFTKKELCSLYGITLPTLNSWIKFINK